MRIQMGNVGSSAIMRASTSQMEYNTIDELGNTISIMPVELARTNFQSRAGEPLKSYFRNWRAEKKLTWEKNVGKYNCNLPAVTRHCCFLTQLQLSPWEAIDADKQSPLLTLVQ